ncbi:MAG: RecQ family ATP-dependent DNA helicase [Bdellovibrionales bacterium]|nr:RecQ family ATP-dependent DNA helicase [Bdellovibrionales bacterium]
MSQSPKTPLNILNSIFGHTSFRGDQAEVIDRALQGLSSLLLMPTGGGKSLCFQIPARLLPGTTVVISPLIALMKDQVDQAKKLGFRVTAINSSIGKDERERRQEGLARGDYELLYVTPERFRSEEFRAAIAKVNVPLLAVDEAHCISEWGGDFRPDYSRILEMRQFLKNPPVLALTATATPQNQLEILLQLGMGSDPSQIFAQDLRRPNLALSVLSVHGLDDKLRALVGLFHQNPGPKVVYCSLISTLRKISDGLHRLGISHLTYHGDLDDRARRRNQEAFMSGTCELILATPAFGLGINKADLRAVFHAEIPGRLEAYYQEVGRAGRDGLPAKGVVLYDPDDVSIQMDFLKWANPDPGFIQTVYRWIEKEPLRVKTEGLDFLRAQLNFYNRRDYRLETSLNLLERWGSIQWNRETRGLDVTAVEAPSGEWIAENHTQARLKSDQSALLQMVQYAEMATGCRMLRILEYFGSGFVSKETEVSAQCGLCDLCQAAQTETT